MWAKSSLECKMKIRFLLWRGGYGSYFHEPTARMRGIRIYETLRDRGIDAAQWDGREDADVIVVQYDPRQVARAAMFSEHVIWDCNDAVFHEGHPFSKSVPQATSIVSWVTCGSTRIQEHMRRFFDPERTSYWREMVDPLYDGVVRAPDGTGRILWMGGADNIQFFEVCDAALERLAKVRPFTMVFCCPAANKPGIRNADIIKEKPYPTEFVEWTWDGNVPTSIIDEMGKADLALVPLSQTDWCWCKSPGKAATFAGVGLPVIASDVPSYREFIADGENGFLAFGPDDWDGPIDELLRDRGLRERMGAAGMEIARARYSLDVVVDQFVGILGKLGGA